MSPHPDREFRSLGCAVITASDTRTPQSDRSGHLIQELLQAQGHRIEAYGIVKDEPEQILEQVRNLCDRIAIEVLIFNGGTGIAPRDTTYDALASIIEKTLPGFGEIFRYLSYQEIGSRAIASRAVAGVYRQRIIFSLPGSSNAVKLAMNELILPELIHLVTQINR